ncbi:hypothetical protein EDB83DRAFT_1843095 [Lactarius deliciosus]|nr:hypothetical protein EDB83DRAFT_1843095 [Lactarius deliciosus]
MYLEMATEEDKKTAEGWKVDADGILIITGLFSAAVASLISVSIQDIRPNPQDTSNLYLANIYQTLTDPASTSHPASPPIFSAKLCSLSEHAVVLELGHQHQLCSTRNVASAVGTKISQGHSATLQSTQASKDPFVLCWRRHILREPSTYRLCSVAGHIHDNSTPPPSFALSCMITLRRSLFPWPIPMCLPHASPVSCHRKPGSTTA